MARARSGSAISSPSGEALGSLASVLEGTGGFWFEGRGHIGIALGWHDIRCKERERSSLGNRGVLNDQSLDKVLFSCRASKEIENFTRDCRASVEISYLKLFGSGWGDRAEGRVDQISMKRQASRRPDTKRVKSKKNPVRSEGRTHDLRISFA